jgi:hypothetical protein
MRQRVALSETTRQRVIRSETTRWRVVLVICLTLFAGCESSASKPVSPTSSSATGLPKAALSVDDEVILRKLCTQCHLYVEPSVLPKKEWDAVIPRMAQMPGYGRTIPRRLDTSAIVQWFRERAPEMLTFADRSAMPIEPPPLKHFSVRQPQSKDFPFVSQVRIATHPETKERALFVCDMHSGWICETKSGSDPLMPLVARKLSDQISHAVRTQSVDLDGDGRQELLVANLGSFAAMDHNLGSVDWLRPKENGFEKFVLADNLGRVADIKPFDFDGDGDLDLAVAEFGWRLSGHVLLLENTTRKDGSSRPPQFTPRTIDERHGAVQVEITDIDGNGRPDVIALLAQEHEMLVAYLNLPDGSFKARELFRAPHSVWGYSGFQLLDFDGDQDLDVLITNGDMMDGPTIKPYHSIAWLENTGDMKFVEHTLAELPGAHRAEAVDLDGDGDFDIVACTLVPSGAESQAERQGSKLPPSLVWLEQTEPLKFHLHIWERGPGRYPTLTAGDFDGDGKADVVLGVGRWQKPDKGEENESDLEFWLSGSR